MFTPIVVTAEDLQARASDRLLSQFNNSPVLKAVLSAIIAEVEQLTTAILQVIQLRSPADAVVEQLNTIGRIVGVIRGFTNLDNGFWLISDRLSSTTDADKAWVIGAPDSGVAPMVDSLYASIISAKVVRNFSQFASMADIQDVVKEAFGINIGFQIDGILEATILVPAGTPQYIIDYIGTIAVNSRIDAVQNLPIPATVKINGISEGA